MVASTAGVLGGAYSRGVSGRPPQRPGAAAALALPWRLVGGAKTAVCADRQTAAGGAVTASVTHLSSEEATDRPLHRRHHHKRFRRSWTKNHLGLLPNLIQIYSHLMMLKDIFKPLYLTYYDINPTPAGS